LIFPRGFFVITVGRQTAAKKNMPVQREMSTEVPRPHIENWFTTREERVTHVTAKKGKLISQVQYLLESA
jgi:hypothetical protein